MSPVRGAVPWAVVAAGCAAVVCLVAWPAYALTLGIVIGAAALLAGLRGLLAEQRRRTPAGPSRRHALAFNALSRALADNREFVRLSVRDEAARAVLAALDADTPTVSSQAAACAGCAGCGGPDYAQHPDISGRDPEAARAHPDAGGEQRADQAGEHPDASGQHAGPGHAMLAALAEAISALPAPAPHHPDAALRGRVAAVLLARIKQAVITDATPFGPGPVSTLIAATEYDLADVVLAELAPELDALTAARAGDGPWLRAYREDLIAAQDAIQRIERQAQDWARLAPAHDVGCTPDDTAYANAGRILLDLLSEPVSTEEA